MGLFDLFSNDTAEQAAAQRNAGLTAGYNAAAPQYAAGTQAATDLTQSGLAGATGASNGGIAGATGAVNNGLTQAGSLTNSGIGSISNYAQHAIDPWQAIYGSATAGANAYGDATGANGSAGQARARANFQTDPGYGFQMDQGLQALDRTAAARGALTGNGGLTADTLRYSQGLADQAYGNYINRLSPYLGQQNAAAGGIAGANSAAGGQAGSLYGNLANLNATGGNTLAAGNVSAGNSLAGINGTLYGNLGNLANSNYQRTGDLANSMNTGIGASNAAATMNNYNVGANQLGALLGVGQLGLGAIGGSGGLSNLWGGLTGGANWGANNPGANGSAYYGPQR